MADGSVSTLRAPCWLSTAVVCAALLAIFAGIAWLASRSKSPTYDEPLHALSGWIQLHDHDFRIDPEDPPLWKYWAALPNGSDAIKFPSDSTLFARVADDLYHEWHFTVEALYNTDENAAKSDDFIQRSRAMMLVVALVLGAVIAWWGWQLGGPVAAIIAVALFCFDPNFLAHSPLVKNDVAMSLCAAAVMLAVWRAGRRLTVWNALAISLLCAAAVTVKFTGLLLGPIVAMLLLARAINRQPWDTFWRRLELRSDKLVVAIGVIVLAMFVSFGGIWANYAFRFGPSPDPNVRLNMKQMVVYASMAELTVKLGRMPTTQETEDWRPSLMTKAILIMDDMHFLPQAWLNGLLYTYQSALSRKTFLNGAYSETGWWYYFPLAMLYKTPLATLAGGGIALAVLIVIARSTGWKPIANWTAACLFIPPAFYLLVAMRSNLNLGLRHVLPVYPFIFLAIGVAGGWAWQHTRRFARPIAAILAIGLAAETVVAFPNYIPFFNAAAGGSRGGLKLLGDSNLDWGQDLKLLAQWQQDHPDTNLYLVYFGLADPWAYGIRYVNFPGGYAFGPKQEVRAEPGVIAISATTLQGIYLGSASDPGLRGAYNRLRELEPIQVLGGSIYLYRWPPPKITPIP